MPPSILLTMRTADRSPRKNYLHSTLASLYFQGVKPDDVHVCCGDDDWNWLMPIRSSVTGGKGCHTPNRNGLSQIDLVDHYGADWIVMTEDDLLWCHDPLGSMARWLDDHARPDVSVYRFFTFGQWKQTGPYVAETPLKEQKGSQAVALRREDAFRFKAWAEAHERDWRPKGAPFQNEPHRGFDKLIGYWALRDKGEKVGLVSLPFFCRHMGSESSLYSRAITRDHAFAGESWSYKGLPCPA